MKIKTIIKYIKFCFNYFRIPKGDYCYEILEVVYPENGSLPYLKTKRCPYWEKIEEQPPQDDGYCHWLEMGDNDDEHMGLLWDQVKECGLREYSEKEEEKAYKRCMKERNNGN